MNRIMLKAGMRCLIFIFAAICIISLAVPAYSADSAIARLTSFSGTVLIKNQGKWGVQPEEGLALYSGDKVVTRTGIATITFDDGAVMEIKANSNLLIKETEDTTALARGVGAVKRQVRLLMGKLFFKSGRSTSTSTTLETTTMVCGLRGTEGILSIDAAGVTYLQFSEGGGDTIGDFIAGVAPDVPIELADLNPAQRAGFVAAAAADQANQVAERLAMGEVTDADAAFAAAKAAEAAALEAKAAAEAMLNNPDPEIREEAKAAIKAANAAIKAAREAQKRAIEAGAEGEITTEEEIEEEFGFDVSYIDTIQGNEFDIINVLPEETPPDETETYAIGSFGAGMRDITTCHSGYYTYTGTEYDSASYSYEYAEDGSSGYTFYSYTTSDPYYYSSTSTYYNDDGTTDIITYNSDTGTTEEEGTWDRATIDVTTFGDPPDESGLWELSYEYEDEVVMGFSGMELSGNLYVDGSMWGTEAQTEEGVTLTAEGEISGQADSNIWWDEAVYSNTTYDEGGAYYGIFGGLKNGNNLEAGLAAIGVAPDGTVGLLRGGGYLDPIAGTIADDNSFEMEGPLTWDPKGPITGVTAANLIDNIHIADDGYFQIAATLGDNSLIGSGWYYYYGESSENFMTANITTSTESAPWGIYGGETFGEYDTTTTADTWSGHVGGYGGFGVIFDEDYYSYEEEYPDNYGWYVGSVENGTWTGGEIAGSLTGSFLSQTKMGDIEGDIVGTYDSTTGDWALGALGAWDGEDLTFASEEIYSINAYGTTEYYYSATYSDSGTTGGSFYYTYYEDNTYGTTTYHPTESYYPYTYTIYDEDGTTSERYYTAYGVYTETPGTWDPSQDLLADIVTQLPEDDNVWYESYSYVSFERIADFAGAMLGGTGSLWAGGAPVRAMGSYSDSGEESPGVFVEEYVFSNNYIDDTGTATYDGGAYHGSLGGIILDDGSLVDELDARFIGIYLDPDGNAGILTGALAGYGYEDLGVFEMNGTIDSVEMEADFGMDPDELTYTPFSTDLVTGTGYFSEGGYIFFEEMDADGYYLNNLDLGISADWGVSIIEGYGTYEGTASDDWSASLILDNTTPFMEWCEITGTQWSDGLISGDIAGAWLDLADAQTGVSGGEIAGIFDPNTFRWRAYATEAWMETSIFLDMVENNPSALQALNIPCVSVGVTDLSFTDTSGDTSIAGVTMNDVEFFAYSTGEMPKIWATGDVQGTTRFDPQGDAFTLANTDSSVSVQFYMNSYVNTEGETWNASVGGSGTVSGYPIIMQGGAAGTVDTEYGTAEGTFSGTASGVAEED